MSTKTWRDLPPTEKQIAALGCVGCAVPATRGEAFDLIGRLLGSGEMVKICNGVPVRPDLSIRPNTDITDVCRLFAKIEAEHGDEND